jgi:hypothetical protein
MAIDFVIAEVFEITGRGAVAVIDQVTDRTVGKAHPVEVVTPTGEVLRAEAFKEYLLRRQLAPIEKEAYMLRGLHKIDIPSGSRLRFV